MEANGDLDNLTSSISDTRYGRGFRAFLNSPVGRVYFGITKKRRETLCKN